MLGLPFHFNLACLLCLLPWECQNYTSGVIDKLKLCLPTSI